MRAPTAARHHQGVRRRYGALFSGFCVAVIQAACEAAPAHEAVIAIPGQHDWKDCGRIIQPGARGEWDHILWGGFALSAAKKNGIYYLYYQGSRSYDESEGTVAWRSIGVATSTDGIRFTKHVSNPVITWFPKNNLEEGAASAAALIDHLDQVVIYYGANTWAGGELVNADARVAVAPDGVGFTDTGIALDRSDRSVWGAGDELFPIVAVRTGAMRVVYYVPNGTLQRGRLGVAWGDSSKLTSSSAALSGGRPIAAWGPGGAAPVGANTFALFLSSERASAGKSVHVRTVSLERPAHLSEPVVSYDWEDVSVATVLLDEDAGKWFLYYRTGAHDSYHVKVAPLVHSPARLGAPTSCCDTAASDSRAECA